MIRLLLLIFCLSIFSQVSYADTTQEINISEWSTLPIAHEGRIKPIDSFARLLLKKISGRETTSNLSASEWLAEVIFNPSQAMERKIFKASLPEVLKLEQRKNKHYSYIEIAVSIDKNKEIISQLIDAKETDWTPDQRELMRVFQNYILMTQALRSLTTILPLPLKIPENIKNNDGETTNYLALKKLEKTITERVKKIVKQKGTNLEKYSEKELQIAELSFQLKTIESGGKNNVLFKIYPENPNNNDANWLSPWEIMLNGKGSPQSAKFIREWQGMALSYQQKDGKKFNTLVKKNRELTQGYTSTIKIEKIFNYIPLKNMATGIYFILFLTIIFTSLRGIDISQYTSIISTLFNVSLATHLLLIISRIFILNRPPVGTLYESVLFVSLICALVMFIVSLKQVKEKKLTSIFIGSLSAFALLFISNGLVEDNKMATLAAVLNTNFWLSTHVIFITIGYGFCLIAGIMAHTYLFQIVKNKNSKKALQDFFKTILTISIFALLFTGIGTILGGIWADQSWGRFWGWDPKENGALLIVLWLIWLLHSRISGHLHQLGFIVGLAFINIIVILAWFGVNLLNVGLHSYGFIEGIALSIGAFCFFEIILISTLAIKAQKINRAIK